MFQYAKETDESVETSSAAQAQSVAVVVHESPPRAAATVRQSHFLRSRPGRHAGGDLLHDFLQ